MHTHTYTYFQLSLIGGMVYSMADFMRKQNFPLKKAFAQQRVSTKSTIFDRKRLNAIRYFPYVFQKTLFVSVLNTVSDFKTHVISILGSL